jgi:hypothetical protein
MNTQAELSAGTGVNDEAVLNFEPGKKYRIRIINMSALSSESLASARHVRWLMIVVVSVPLGDGGT